MTPFLFYTLFYLLMSGCIVYPPTEFVSAGLTIGSIFAEWLGNENEFFIQYHIKRSIITLFIHLNLPFGYLIGLYLFGHMDYDYIYSGKANALWLFAVLATLCGPIYSIYKSYKLIKDRGSSHPIAQSLAIYANNNTTWSSVASEVNIEYRRIDKIVIDTNSINRVVATDNWIIKVVPYRLYIAHQSDTALVVNNSDTHELSHTTRGGAQFINIEVKPTRSGAESFNIRLNALDFKDLQDRVARPITILQNVTFHKTLSERFIDAFKEVVEQNPRYDTAQELELCIGCMVQYSDVKLTKLCDSEESRPDGCNVCFCKPMWCIDCIAKWFISRQDENTPGTWLASKCTCPMCRARFCLLDVCYVRPVTE